MAKTLSEGVVHTMPADLRKALLASPEAIEKWEDITPLARNEWICWVATVKSADTRKDHVRRTVTELIEGKRRPCCWLGCIHRTDKAMSPSQKFVSKKRSTSR